MRPRNRTRSLRKRIEAVGIFSWVLDVAVAFTQHDSHDPCEFHMGFWESKATAGDTSSIDEILTLDRFVKLWDF